MKRRAGIIQITGNGQRWDAKGNFSYNLGRPKRTTIQGADKMHGYMEEPQAAFVEGEITDSKDLSLDALVTGEGLTIVLQLAVGPSGPAKAVVLKDAAFTADGTGNSKEGNIPVRWESDSGDEVTP
jgi:hypothetical protein